MCATIADASDATTYSPAPIPTISGAPFRATTSVSGSFSHSTQIAYLTLAVAEGLLVFTAGLLARVVGSVGERQRERVRVLGPAAPFAPSEVTDVPDGAAEQSGPARPPLVRSTGSAAVGRY